MVAAAQTQFGIKGQKTWPSAAFQQRTGCAADLPIAIDALGFDINPMTKSIDDVMGIGIAIALGVTRAGEIDLVNVVKVDGFPETGMRDSFGGFVSLCSSALFV